LEPARPCGPESEQRGLRVGRPAGLSGRTPEVADGCAAVLAGVGLALGFGVAGAGAQFGRAGPGGYDSPAGMSPAAAAVVAAGHEGAHGDAGEAGGFDLPAHPAAVSGSGVGAGPVEQRPGGPGVEDAGVVPGGQPGVTFAAGSGGPAAATRGGVDGAGVGLGLGVIGPPGEG